MKYRKLLENLGLEADPFAKTNADEEEKLEEYFVAPPFFQPFLAMILTHILL